MTDVSGELAACVQRLREVTELPNQLAQALDVSAIAARTGVSQLAIVGLLNERSSSLADSQRACGLLLEELQQTLREYEIAIVSPGLRSSCGPIRCARGLSQDRFSFLVRWAEGLVDNDRR